MITIFTKNKKGKLISAINKTFRVEEEFEKYIMENTGVLSDIFIIKRRVLGTGGRDIPDMVGIDRDNNIVVIENKNIRVTEDILPQILRYAIWAQTNPDSIKAMWLEAKNRPDDIEINWDNVNIRLIVLAPSISYSVLRLLKQINYNIELIEVKRYLLGKEELILLNRLEPEVEAVRKTARGLEVYDKEFYKNYRNSRSVDTFFTEIGKVDRLIKANKWNLDKKFNKYYIGYKIGFFNVFGIHWIGTKSFEFFFKIPRTQFRRVKQVCPYEMEYDDRWKQATVRHTDNTKINRLSNVFKKTIELSLEK